MAKAGFINVSIAPESFDVQALLDFNKRLDVKRADQSIQIIKESGIRCSLNFIVFAPKITTQGLIVTLRKALEYAKQGIRVNPNPFVIPYPATQYHKNSFVVW